MIPLISSSESSCGTSYGSFGKCLFIPSSLIPEEHKDYFPPINFEGIALPQCQS